MNIHRWRKLEVREQLGLNLKFIKKSCANFCFTIYFTAHFLTMNLIEINLWHKTVFFECGGKRAQLLRRSIYFYLNHQIALSVE